MMIRYCKLFDLPFERLEGLMARELGNIPVDKVSPDLRSRGPHRHGDFTYVPADSAKAFGTAVLSIISSEWCSNDMIADLSQAILSNDDGWMKWTPLFGPRV
jgi:hypothetical protein